jgi:hypothetical protein
MFFEDVKVSAKRVVQGKIARLKFFAEATRQGTSSEQLFFKS